MNLEKGGIRRRKRSYDTEDKGKVHIVGIIRSKIHLIVLLSFTY